MTFYSMRSWARCTEMKKYLSRKLWTMTF